MHRIERYCKVRYRIVFQSLYQKACIIPLSNLMPSITMLLPPPPPISFLCNQALSKTNISYPSIHPSTPPSNYRKHQIVKVSISNPQALETAGGLVLTKLSTAGRKSVIWRMTEPFLPDREIYLRCQSLGAIIFTHSETQSCLPKSTLILEKNSRDIPQKP